MSEWHGQEGATPDAPLTVYTLRLTTSTARGAALSDPWAGVNVCLVGANGSAVLHRISPVNDPLDTRAHTEEMCQLIDGDVGADCSGVLADLAAATGGPAGAQAEAGAGAGKGLLQQGPASLAGRQGQMAMRAGSSGSTPLVGRPPPPPPPKRRFQEGAVDEVSLLAPCLGPLAGLLVGVEGGTWALEEADVACSRSGHADRFVCRRTLGGAAGEGAAWLAPVPPGAVVYGEGEAAMVLTQEQASALRSMSLSDYAHLKRRVSTTTALLVAAGASLAALAGGTAAAAPFAAGGALGLLYQWLLMRGVDHVMAAAAAGAAGRQALTGGGAAPQASSQPRHLQPVDSDSDSVPFTGLEPSTGPEAEGAAPASPALRSSDLAARLLASAPLRLGVVCAAAALGLAMLPQEEAATSGLASTLAAGAGNAAAGEGPPAALQLALAALGFLTYKVALVGCSIGEGSGGGGAADVGARAAARSRTSKAQVEKFKRD